jgi:hypothetical protein
MEEGEGIRLEAGPGLVGHQHPTKDVEHDLRSGEQQAQHEQEPDNVGLDAELAGDARTHAGDHPVVPGTDQSGGHGAAFLSQRCGNSYPPVCNGNCRAATPVLDASGGT